MSVLVLNVKQADEKCQPVAGNGPAYSRSSNLVALRVEIPSTTTVLFWAYYMKGTATNKQNIYTQNVLFVTMCCC
jgi:hypothetical protein